MAGVLDGVRRTIQQNQLLTPGGTVVVGVSGGPDSLCLLHLLRRLRPEYDLTLHVAHLHHGLRGADADADAEFVRELADEWGLPCTVEHTDVPALAREHKLAFEEAARRARYDFLGRVAAGVGAATIAVGHNADDQAETVFMHFLRGSGLAGLRGMLPRTFLEEYRLFEGRKAQGARDKARGKIDKAQAGKSGAEPPTSRLQPLTSDSQPPTSSLQIIRPLLQVTRAEIEAYCDRNGLEPRLDRSNLDTTCFRNWLRHEVLPLLSRHNPNVRGVIRRSARVIRDDHACLRSLLEEVWVEVVLDEPPPLEPGLRADLWAGVAGDRAEGGWEPRITFDLAAWRALPTSLQRSTLREAIHRLRRSLRNINFQHVENALLVARDGTTGDQATLPQGLMLTVGYGRFTISAAQAREPVPDWPLLSPQAAPLPLAVPGDTPLTDSDWALRVRVLAVDDLTPEWAANPDRWQAFLDSDAVGPELWLRTRVPGDRFQPQGLDGHTAKLADFYTNQKVPRALRDRLPLLEGKAGVAWVCGWRVDERARLREATERVLLVRFVRWNR